MKITEGKKRGRELEVVSAAGTGDEEATRIPSSRFSKVDSSTLAYFTEIDEHFKSLTDDEEKHILADNALGEARGKEAQVATDAACSRVVEALIPHASTQVLCIYLSQCVEGENLAVVCTRYGSHLHACIMLHTCSGDQRQRQLKVTPHCDPLLAAAPLDHMLWKSCLLLSATVPELQTKPPTPR
jgi:hypothetical protein